MPIDTANALPLPSDAGLLPVDQLPPARSLARQAMIDTFGRKSAWAGLGWLIFLALVAVFAPFIANSHPLLMKMNGRWSSPLLRHLTRADVLLLIAFGALVWRFVKRPPTYVFVAAINISALICLLFVRPLPNVVYAQYRQWTAEGKIDRAVYAMIPYSPIDRLRDQPEARLQPPSHAHWFGTDTNGADVLSNLLHASRIALSVGFIATSISVVLGVIIGGVMGYYAGTVDLLGMRLIEIFESIPRLFLLIAITAFREERDIYLMMTVIGLTGWTSYARFLRAEFFTLRKQDFVQAALAGGVPTGSILFRHMLPNGLTPILVNSTFDVASAILYESTLSFLGLGLVDQASWGALLNQARAGGTGFIWWIATFPGLAIFLTVFSYNLVGEAVRDALDPKLRKRD